MSVVVYTPAMILSLLLACLSTGHVLWEWKQPGGVELVGSLDVLEDTMQARLLVQGGRHCDTCAPALGSYLDSLSDYPC